MSGYDTLPPSALPEGPLPPPAAGRPTPAPRLALIELLDRDGHVRQALPVTAWPARIGRAIDNDLVIDDPHVAANHATIEPDGDGIAVVVGDTVNGLRAEGRVLKRGERLAIGAQPLRLGIGDSMLRVRLAGHALEPEQPLRVQAFSRIGPWPLVALIVLALGGLAFDTWLDADPDTLTRALGSVLFGAVVAGLGWCGAWALVSKLFTRRSHFAWHVRVLLMAVVTGQAATLLANLLAFSFSWPPISSFAFLATNAIGAAGLYGHLLGLEPRRRRGIVAATVAAFVAATGIAVWTHQQQRDQWGAELYMTHLFPPALRAARTSDTASFVQRLAPLQATLDRRARERGNGADGGGDDDGF